MNPKDGEGLAKKVVHFAGHLKGHGFKAHASSIEDGLRGLECVPVAGRQDFFNVLRANLCTGDLEWHQFPSLFERYWDRHPDGPLAARDPGGGDGEAAEPDPVDSREMVSGGRAAVARPDPSAEEQPRLEGRCFSPVSAVSQKDLSDFDQADIQTAQLVLKQMSDLFRIQRSRRSRRSRRAGNMDFRRVLQRSLKGEGFPVELFYRERRKRLKRMVILADVSGSMDRYARHVIPFLLGLRGVGARAEVFVFSTVLAPITRFIRHLPVADALKRISEEFPEWSGGTRIGHSLHQFNQGRGQTLGQRRSVVVILSDGWDLGAREMLRREMEILHHRAHTVVWLNPLAQQPEYAPVCQGMETALPYVDYLLPADSLESLRQVGRLLSKLMVH